MSFNIVTDPDDLLGKIPPNITRDMEIVVRRIEGLLPSLYMGLKTVLEKARPKRARYRHELAIVEEILKFLDNPGNSYLIGVPFQPATIKDDKIDVAAHMAIPTFRFLFLGFTKCTVLIFPVTTVYSDNMLRSALAHELVHCVVGDIHERITYRFEKMLTDLVPDLFLAVRYAPKHMAITITEYIKQNRVPVADFETAEFIVTRIATRLEYARQILSKSVMIQLKPLVRGD